MRPGANRATHTGNGATESIARRACPDADECRRRWLALEDGAECRYCYQRLERHELARILAGRAS